MLETPVGAQGYGGPPRGPVGRLSGGGDYEHQGSYLSRNSNQVQCPPADGRMLER